MHEGPQAEEKIVSGQVARILQALVDLVLVQPEVAITDQEVEAKFRRAVEPKYGKEKASAVLHKCWELEKLTSVTELIAMFATS